MRISAIPNYLKLMRFDKPIGWLLLLWPTAWALWVATQGAPSATLCWVFGLGVFVMRSAGCVINDYADRDFDPMVERTQDRPLASGVVQPKEALQLFGLLSLIALGLLLMLPSSVWPWALPAMIITIAYPFMKRFIQAPQAVLGIAFSFGIPMIYVAEGRVFDWTFVLLFAMNFCWVLVYDTAYAMSDREDDLKIGVKSTAILFGEYDRLAVGLFQVAVLVALVLLKLELALSNWFYMVMLIVAGMFAHQQRLISERDRAKCFQAFLNNAWVGGTIWFGFVAG